MDALYFRANFTKTPKYQPLNSVVVESSLLKRSVLEAVQSLKKELTPILIRISLGEKKLVIAIIQEAVKFLQSKDERKFFSQANFKNFLENKITEHIEEKDQVTTINVKNYIFLYDRMTIGDLKPLLQTISVNGDAGIEELEREVEKSKTIETNKVVTCFRLTQASNEPILPNDMVLKILQELSMNDLIHMANTCKGIYEFICNSSVFSKYKIQFELDNFFQIYLTPFFKQEGMTPSKFEKLRGKIKKNLDICTEQTRALAKSQQTIDGATLNTATSEEILKQLLHISSLIASSKHALDAGAKDSLKAFLLKGTLPDNLPDELNNLTDRLEELRVEPLIELFKQLTDVEITKLADHSKQKDLKKLRSDLMKLFEYALNETKMDRAVTKITKFNNLGYGRCIRAWLITIAVFVGVFIGIFIFLRYMSICDVGDMWDFHRTCGNSTNFKPPKHHPLTLSHSMV